MYSTRKGVPSPHVIGTLMIYPSHAYHRHLLSSDLAHPRARVVTHLCFALRPLCVLFVSLCLPLLALPFLLTIPPTVVIHSPWAAMVAHSAMGHSLHLSCKTAHKNHPPPPLPPDPADHGLSSVQPCWGPSPPPAQSCPSTKGPPSTCPHRGPASHPLSLSPLEPQAHRQIQVHRI